MIDYIENPKESKKNTINNQRILWVSGKHSQYTKIYNIVFPHNRNYQKIE